jgi:transcriptional regulator with XRE-family HTH domain
MDRTGSLIRDARQARGVTQAQLAARLGITQPSVARMEAAGDEVSVATLRRALIALGRTLEMRAADQAPSYDETLLRENLGLTPAERLERMLQGRARFAALATATQRARDGG